MINRGIQLSSKAIWCSFARYWGKWKWQNLKDLIQRMAFIRKNPPADE
jgi:hypothetical protein